MILSQSEARLLWPVNADSLSVLSNNKGLTNPSLSVADKQRKMGFLCLMLSREMVAIALCREIVQDTADICGY